MALIECPECKKEVSDMAVSCPECGYPVSEYASSASEEEADDGLEETNVSGDITAIAARLLEQETSPEVQEIKLEMLRRIARESDVKPSRIPAPLNITEIGGYFNLLMKLKQEEMLQQTIASILGLPMNPPK
jgi:hypothetical protein